MISKTTCRSYLFPSRNFILMGMYAHIPSLEAQVRFLVQRCHASDILNDGLEGCLLPLAANHGADALLQVFRTARRPKNIVQIGRLTAVKTPLLIKIKKVENDLPPAARTQILRIVLQLKA